MLRILSLLLVLTILICPIGLWWFAQRSLPMMDGIVTITDLSGGAAVKFDARAIPYIEASTDEDLMVSQGYVTAQERIFQMDILRRTAKGELSEIFGSTCLAQDKLTRTVGITRTCQAELKQLTKEGRALLDAYSRGVNSYISEHQDSLPVEFLLLGYRPRPWEPLDSLAILKYQQYQLEATWPLDDLRQRVLDKTNAATTAYIFGHDIITQPVPAQAQPVPTPPGSATITPTTVSPGSPATPGAATTPSPGSTTTSTPQAPAKGTTTPATQGAPPSNSPAPTSPSTTSPAPTTLPVTPSTRGALPQADTISSRPISDIVGQHPNLSWGSNGWVVSGTMTDSRGSLLAIDKHTAFTTPDQWFLCSLSTASTHVAGATIPGVPGILNGRNDNIGWGSVAFKADTQDLFIEQFSPQFPTRYRTPEGWANSEEVIEEIPVRFAKNYLHKVVLTRHGPVLLKSEDSAVVLAWSGNDANPPAWESLWNLSKCKTWPEFTACLEKYKGATQTFLFADKGGGTAFQVAGNIPVRNPANKTGKLRGDLFLPGWTGQSDWVSRLKFSELPKGTNPSNGYVVAEDQRLAGQVQITSPYRPLRINNVLASEKKGAQRPGLPEMAQLQGDEYAYLGPLVRKEIQSCVNRSQNIDRFQLSALDMLDRWDGFLKTDSTAAAVYESFLSTAAHRVLVPKLGVDLTNEYLQRWPRWSVVLEKLFTEKPKDWLPHEERTYETFVLTTFSQAIKYLRLGTQSDEPTKWPWRAFHKVTFTNVVFTGLPDMTKYLGWLFNNGTIGVGGDGDCVNACDLALTGEDPWRLDCTSGPSLRLLIDMSDNDKFYVTMAQGQSEHILSSHRGDQTRPWLSITPLPFAFSAEYTDKQLQHKLILSNH